jgi:hypothetical protein
LHDQGTAALEIQDMWQNVDRPGLISLVWYDPIVVRNRYSHVVTREKVRTTRPQTRCSRPACPTRSKLTVFFVKVLGPSDSEAARAARAEAAEAQRLKDEAEEETADGACGQDCPALFRTQCVGDENHTIELSSIDQHEVSERACTEVATPPCTRHTAHTQPP